MLQGVKRGETETLERYQTTARKYSVQAKVIENRHRRDKTVDCS